MGNLVYVADWRTKERQCEACLTTKSVKYNIGDIMYCNRCAMRVIMV